MAARSSSIATSFSTPADLPSRLRKGRSYGSGILAEDGQIDRRALGARAFGDPARLERLNQIVHPPVFRKEEQLMAEFAARDISMQMAPIEGAADIRRDVNGNLINNGRVYTFSLPAGCGSQCSQPYTQTTYTTGTGPSTSPSASVR